jgi:hypothetical protein
MNSVTLSEDARALLESFRDDINEKRMDGDTLMAFASFVQGHSEAKSIELQLLIIQALAQSAERLGSEQAATFLETQWPQLKNILPKRWARAGFEP